MRRSFAVVLAVAVAVALAAPATALGGRKGKADIHKPPYKKGNQGGDRWNYVHADPKTGEVSVLRFFPGISPVVGCAPEPDAGWATLTEKHHVTERIDSITIAFDGEFEPYAWVYAVVWDEKGDSLGLDKFQGPHTGNGKLKVKLFRQPRENTEVEIEFGAQLGDSCPQVGGAMVSFPSITVD